MGEPERKALKIKTGSVKRLAKELVLYGKEQEKEEQRVAEMRASGADSHDIKHAVSEGCAANQLEVHSICNPRVALKYTQLLNIDHE